MSGLGMFESPEEREAAMREFTATELPTGAHPFLAGSELEPERGERPPAPMPPPPSAVLKWLQEVLEWADALRGVK